MDYIISKFKHILGKIKESKKLTYLSLVGLLVAFALILNITYSVFSEGANIVGTNITVNNLKYNMIINEVKLNESVGTSVPSNTIIGDRIVLLKTGKTEQFNIVLTSLNDISSKYEVVYKVCSDVNCNKFIETPEDISVAYHMDTPFVSGSLSSNESVIITLVTENLSEQDYYVQIGLNVGYTHNELALTNQITNEFTPASLEGLLSIVAYVDGEEVEGFPTEPSYDYGIACQYEDGSSAPVNYTFRFIAGKGWEVDVLGLDRSLTTCRIDFKKVMVFTYESLVNRYDCANLADGSHSDNPVISYSGNCELIKDDETNDEGEHKWRMKFLTSGTLTLSGLTYVDAFLVGGGTKGSDSHSNVVPGSGGDTVLLSRIGLDEKTSYTVTVGAASANTTFNGTTATAGGNTVDAGQCEFLETSGDVCKYTDNGYQGHYGAKGGQTTYGGGRNGSGGDCYGGSVTQATAGATNTGAGGGAGNRWDGACNDGYGNWYGFGSYGQAGGSGIVIIRDARA